jgi:hypothetical protein
MAHTTDDHRAIAELRRLASDAGLDVAGGTIRRSSSRICFGFVDGITTFNKDL